MATLFSSVLSKYDLKITFVPYILLKPFCKDSITCWLFSVACLESLKEIVIGFFNLKSCLGLPDIVGIIVLYVWQEEKINVTRVIKPNRFMGNVCLKA